jgi:hypothetical protein
VSNGDKSLKILLLTLSGIILIFIILSAQRLNLYENAYGLTLLRWHGYMILLGLFLLFLTQIVLISTNQNFQNNFRNILLIVLLLQSSSNMVNPENFIAMYNFERQLQQDLSLNRKFDSMYVQSL